MKMECFKIILNKQIPVYHSGETVSGTVLINLTEPIRFNKVLMNILGKARVYWWKFHLFIYFILKTKLIINISV